MRGTGVCESPSPYHQEKLSLAADVLRSGYRLSLKVLGASMFPTIWPGDILAIEPVRTEGLRSGDIVFVIRESRVLVHRLRHKIETPQGPSWITRGDAVLSDDPPMVASQVLGKVVGRLRGNNRRILPVRFGISGRALSWMFCHSDLSLRLALRLHSVIHRDQPPCTSSNEFSGKRREQVLLRADADR
jgi:signal peptidase